MDVQHSGAWRDWQWGNPGHSIQVAIDACYKAGGGMVYCPPGDYLTGLIQIKSNVNLYIEAGATLLGSGEQSDYSELSRDILPVLGRLSPSTHLVYAHDADNVAITGRGAIDVGDDCIALKSHEGQLGRSCACENVTVSNCVLSSTCCAVRIGYEGDSPIRNCTFSNLVMPHTRTGINMLVSRVLFQATHVTTKHCGKPATCCEPAGKEFGDMHTLGRKGETFSAGLQIHTLQSFAHICRITVITPSQTHHTDVRLHWRRRSHASRGPFGFSSCNRTLPSALCSPHPVPGIAR